MSTIVYDLRKSVKNYQDFSCSAIEAVIAAYAQDLGDWNTWDYHNKYSEKVVVAAISVACGDFSAFRDDISLDERNKRFDEIQERGRKLREEWEKKHA